MIKIQAKTKGSYGTQYDEVEITKDDIFKLARKKLMEQYEDGSISEITIDDEITVISTS